LILKGRKSDCDDIDDYHHFIQAKWNPGASILNGYHIAQGAI